MKYFFLGVFTLWVCDVISAQSWAPLSVGVATPVMDISFPSNDTGFATLGNGTLRKTDDGGMTWSNVGLHEPNTSGPIEFLSSSKGFMVDDSGIVSTANGGASWSFCLLNTNVLWMDIFFCDQLVGYVSGISPTVDTFHVYKTIDGGMNWLPCTPIQDFNAVFPVIYFRTATEGYIAGSDNLYRTSDGGLTWNNVYTAQSNDLIATVSAPDAGTAYCATQYYMDIAKSTNGGNSWSSTSQTLGSVPYGSHFLSASTGFICGGDGITSGYIVQTTNGGNSFSPAYTGGQTMLSMDFPSSSVGYCGGTGGLVLKYSDPTDIASPSQPQMQCYPNPATDHLTITNVEIGAQLIIRNELGQIAWQQQADNTTMRVDVGSLAQGVYIIEVSGEELRRMKFVKG